MAFRLFAAAPIVGALVGFLSENDGLRMGLVEQGRPHGYELMDQPQNTAAVAQFLKISMRQLVWLRV